MIRETQSRWRFASLPAWLDYVQGAVTPFIFLKTRDMRYGEILVDTRNSATG